MTPFDFKSKTHFVSSIDGATLQIHEFSELATNPSSIQKFNLKEVTTISLVDDGLLFPDGQGMIEGEEALTALAQHLAQLRLMVSPEGLCFHDVSEYGMYGEFEIDYLRLYDLFCWSHHGIQMGVVTVAGEWSRCELSRPVSVESRLIPVLVTIQKEDYEEMRRKVEEVDEAMEMNEELRRKVKKQSVEMEEMNVEANELMKMMTIREDEMLVEMKNMADEMEFTTKMNRELKRKVKVQDEEIMEMEAETEELREKLREKTKELKEAKKNEKLRSKVNNVTGELKETEKRKVKLQPDEIMEMKVETEEFMQIKNERKVQRQDEETEEMNAEIEELMNKNDDRDELGKMLRAKDREIRALKVDIEDASSLKDQELQKE